MGQINVSNDIDVFLRSSDKTNARTNLDLGDSATKDTGTTAGTVAAGDDTRITGAAQKSDNLSDLTNASTARTNLGLGDSSTLDIGTTAGTVAAGDDTRITGAAQKSANLSDIANASTAFSNIKQSATESTTGVVELATQAEVDAADDTTGDQAVRAKHLRIKKESNGALIIGDLSGDARGGDAVDIQSYRGDSTRVASGDQSTAIGYDNTASEIFCSAIGCDNTASEIYSTAIGYDNTASGYQSTAIGFLNTASGNYSTASGYINTASGYYSSAIGSGNNASGYRSSAIGNRNNASGNYSTASGYDNTASGGDSSAIGHRIKTTVNNSTEIGYWSGLTTRGGVIRVQGTGQVAMTIEDSASAPTDGGATAGSEADGTLARGMFAIQKNGTAVTLYFNNAGTIQSLSLGTLS